MNNLKYAKLFLGLGIALGLSIPISVIYNQTVQSKKRKQNILVDQERMKKKLAENPNLRYRTVLTAPPLSDEQYNDWMSSKR